MARNYIAVTLADGATISSVGQGKGLMLAGIIIPKGLTGTSLTFRSYRPDGTLIGVVSDGAGGSLTKTIASATDTYLPLDRNLLAGIDGLSIISGTTQSGAVTLTLVFV